jgi:hypothetical protein
LLTKTICEIALVQDLGLGFKFPTEYATKNGCYEESRRGL